MTNEEQSPISAEESVDRLASRLAEFLKLDDVRLVEAGCKQNPVTPPPAQPTLNLQFGCHMTLNTEERRLVAQVPCSLTYKPEQSDTFSLEMSAHFRVQYSSERELVGVDEKHLGPFAQRYILSDVWHLWRLFVAEIATEMGLPNILLPPVAAKFLATAQIERGARKNG